jgi:hypothetical protein
MTTTQIDKIIEKLRNNSISAQQKELFEMFDIEIPEISELQDELIELDNASLTWYFTSLPTAITFKEIPTNKIVTYFIDSNNKIGINFERKIIRFESIRVDIQILKLRYCYANN